MKPHQSLRLDYTGTQTVNLCHLQHICKQSGICKLCLIARTYSIYDAPHDKRHNGSRRIGRRENIKRSKAHGLIYIYIVEIIAQIWLIMLCMFSIFAIVIRKYPKLSKSPRSWKKSVAHRHQSRWSCMLISKVVKHWCIWVLCMSSSSLLVPIDMKFCIVANWKIVNQQTKALIAKSSQRTA